MYSEKASEVTLLDVYLTMRNCIFSEIIICLGDKTDLKCNNYVFVII